MSKISIRFYNDREVRRFGMKIIPNGGFPCLILSGY